MWPANGREMQPDSLPLLAAGYGYSILVPTSGANFGDHGSMDPTACGQRSPVGFDPSGDRLPIQDRSGEGGRSGSPGNLSRCGAEDVCSRRPSIASIRGVWPNQPKLIRRNAA